MARLRRRAGRSTPSRSALLTLCLTPASYQCHVFNTCQCLRRTSSRTRSASRPAASCLARIERGCREGEHDSGLLRAVHLSRHTPPATCNATWPGGRVNASAVLSGHVMPRAVPSGRCRIRCVFSTCVILYTRYPCREGSRN